MQFFKLVLPILVALLVAGPIHADQTTNAGAVTTPVVGVKGITFNGAVSSMPVLAQRCCKTCRKGKACGNSCIARWKNCTKPPGCACDGK